MKVTTPEIAWHARDPIYSIDFQYVRDDIQRLATCGTDRHVRIWELTYEKPSGKAHIEFRSSLTRHTRTVNVVRFSPCGQMLASAGDDSAIMIWKLNEVAPPANNIFAEEDQDNKETWIMFKVLRSHLEDVYDLSWSSCGKYLLSGSVDNSAIYWDVKKAVRLGMFPDHKSFVQGVAFDPLNKYLATMSADRALRIYSTETKNCLHVVTKVTIPSNNNDKEDEKTVKMFHGDTMKSFFRRLTFTPDGQLLLVPAGCLETSPGEENINASFIFYRGCFTKPVIQLPGPKSATLAIRCNPILFELRQVKRKTPLSNVKRESKEVDGDKTTSEVSEWEKYETMFCLPYRMVFAVATEDSIILYDTQQPIPFAYITNIHYHTLSDLAWTPDGKTLAVSSTDGYVTFISFSDGELGKPYSNQVVEIRSRVDILQKEKEREQERLNKKRAKEEERKARLAEKAEAANASKSASTDKTEERSKTAPVESETVDKHSDIEKKKPRRIPVMTITPASPSTSQTSGNESAEKSEENLNTNNSNSNNASSLLQSPKTPRRVGLTTITKYDSPNSVGDQSNKDSIYKDIATPKSSKRSGAGKKRLSVTTLETFKEQVSIEDNSKVSTDIATEGDGENTSDLHLVMETTCDAAPVNTTTTPSSKQKSDSEKKTPRRVKVTTISTDP